MLFLEIDGRLVPLRGAALSLGADAGCDVVLVGEGVRGSHAVLIVEAERVEVEAVAGATVGIGGREVARGVWRVGEALRVGSVEVWLRAGAATAAATAATASATATATATATAAAAETASATAAASAPATAAATAAASAPARPSVPAAAAAGEPGVRALGAIASLAAELYEERPLRERLEALVRGLVAAAGAERGALLIVGTDGARRIVGASEADEADGALLLSETIVRHVLEAGTPLLLEDAAGSAFAGAASVIAQRLGSAIAVPLRSRGRAAGVLWAARARGRPAFVPAELSAVGALAGIAALLLEGAEELTAARADLQGLTATLRSLREGRLVGESAAMQAVRARIAKIAPVPVTVLVLGETGTGKELVARALHRQSGRRGPFVAVDCAALPPTLIEAELFGAARGAFTGASASRPGRFEAADGGTVFLDELGELPPAAQASLLRVLQEREVTRLGEVRPRKLDVRVVAATNRDLRAEVAAGRFREDLYFRLDELSVTLPPLRARGEDVTLLAELFLRQAKEELSRPNVEGFTHRAREVLQGHDFPGNVRELKARVTAAVALSGGGLLDPSALGLEGGGPVEPLEAARERFVREHVRRAVAAAGGNKKLAAERLGIGLRSIFRYLDEEG